MSEKVTIVVADLIGTPLCITAEDGQMIYKKIVELLKLNKSICVSFERVTTIISLFLNNTIGALYKDYDDASLSRLTYEGLSEEDKAVLDRVIENAKKYYAAPKEFDDSLNEEMNDNDKE